MNNNTMRKCIINFLIIFSVSAVFAGGYDISMPRTGSVKPAGGFWKFKESVNRTVTCPSNIAQCKKTGRIENFTNAGLAIRGQKHGRFKGAFFNDSDVYKVAEGLAYELAIAPDPKMSAELDDMISRFAFAQEKDGYVYTPRPLKLRYERVGPHRWYCDDAHELYCMGHMIEAAVAHYETTGKRNFLDVACRAGDMMVRTFGDGKGQIRFLPGHEEVELALCKLYLATGEKKYLDTAALFLETRGMPFSARKGVVKRGFPSNPAYYQDHKPVKQQRTAVGHSVRAAYLYCAMCDVGVLSGDNELLSAADAIWNDMVSSKMHLTGGLGSDRRIEGFGKAYDLPNESCYLETCAAIGNALFNERMFRRTGNAKYLDIVERVAYNAFIGSTSLSGDEFFYPNPLASSGGRKRNKWFSCACCPPNIVRFIPQFVTWTYSYNEKANTYYWNFFVESNADLGRVKFSQTTDYPISGAAKLSVSPAKVGDRFTLKVRIPGWAQGRPVPFETYIQTTPSNVHDVFIAVNGERIAANPGSDGFVSINRAWRKGDTVSISLPMDVKRIKADDRIAADRDRMAVERGPVVYCAEGAGNTVNVLSAVLPADASFKTKISSMGGLKYVKLVSSTGLELIPYGLWNNRKPGNSMQTWFPVSREAAGGNSEGVIATASHCFHLDSPKAIVDGKIPASSFDESIPRHTFWPHKGTSEWIDIELPVAKKIKKVSVYWFDDYSSGKGGCALPADWKLAWRIFPGLPWEDVKDAAYTTVKDAFSTAVLKKPIETDVIRIKVKCAPGLSAGVLEAVVE